MKRRATTFRQRAAQALADPTVRRNTTSAVMRAYLGRQTRAAEVPEWERLRELARDIKRATLDHLDQHLARFADQVEARGGRVHWAIHGAEVREIILDIARDNRVHRIIKSKSMASEELHLNEALEAAQLEVIETDLGELIVQLAGDGPSHIVLPAIHKTKEDVSELFHQRYHTPRTTEPVELTGHARDQLRQAFLTADMGITGCNFGVAETGTVCLVENEGNIRMTTTLPRVLVTVMGMEKVVPRMADLGVFLRLLARCGTGQKMSCYTNFITGPRGADDADGPDQWHVIIVDNGRSRILAEAEERQVLSCIRCGACLNACPVYRTAGGHAYGAVYPGPIGKLLGPYGIGAERADDLPYASSLCGSCTEVCPVKIDIAHLILRLRHKDHQRRGGGLEGLAFRLWREANTRPAAIRLGGRVAAALRPLADRLGALLPGMVKGWTDTRDLPPFPDKTFADLWPELEEDQ